MKGFVEIIISHSKQHQDTMLFNTNQICEVWIQQSGQTSFSIVGRNSSEFYTTDTPYKTLKEMISESL